MQLHKIRFLLLATFIVLFTNSCNEESASIPKPRGYFRIELPKHEYKDFNPENCPFKFEIPISAIAVPDTNRLSENCWWYIILPKVNGQLYFTYKDLNGEGNKYIEDTRTLVYKHTTKASSIDETLIETQSGIHGIVYDIGGDAASPLQFFVTDSTKHFLRAALYFNTEPNADSLAPVIEYTKQDINRLLETFQWK